MYRPRKPRASPLYQCTDRHLAELRSGGPLQRLLEERVIERFLKCGDWVEDNVLAPVPHRQYVFTVPRMLRPIFSRRRGLLGELCHVVERLLIQAYTSAREQGVAEPLLEALAALPCAPLIRPAV